MQQPMYDQYGRLLYRGPLGTNYGDNPVQAPQQFDLLSTVGNIIGSKVVGDVFGNLFGGGKSQQGQNTAVDRPTQAPKETAGSGEITIPPPVPGGYFPAQQAGLPALIGGGVSLLGKYLPQAIGGAAIGLAAPVLMDQFTGQPKKLRVTKKLKSQVRQAVNLMGIEGTAQAMGVDVNTVLYILMKKMRNDGPYVTKAAVRKTRQTIRKLDTLCDLKDEMCPPKRAPARRRTTTAARTRVTNIKN